MKKALCFIVLLITLFSCSENETTQVEVENEIKPSVGIIEHELKANEIAFADFYYRFSATVESKNYQMFNRFIHPNYGCYVIESSQGDLSLTSVYDVGEFVSKNNEQRFFDLPFEQIDHVVSFEDLPQLICEEQKYTKTGCFSGSPHVFKNAEIWNNFNAKEYPEAEFLINSLSTSVVNTYNYTFHFSKIEENWYLSFIDLRVPCSS